MAACMGGAAAGQDDTTDLAQLRRRHVQAAELGRAFFAAEPTAHRVANGVRLLKDFLEHVMRVIAFLDILRAEFDFADLRLPPSPASELISNLSRSRATTSKSFR